MRVRAGKIKAPHDHKIQNHQDGLQPWCDTCHLSAGFQRPKSLAALFGAPEDDRPLGDCRHHRCRGSRSCINHIKF